MKEWLSCEFVSVFYIVFMMIDVFICVKVFFNNFVKIILLGVDWLVEFKKKFVVIWFYFKLYDFYGILEFSFVIYFILEDSKWKLYLVGCLFYNV